MVSNIVQLLRFSWPILYRLRQRRSNANALTATYAAAATDLRKRLSSYCLLYKLNNVLDCMKETARQGQRRSNPLRCRYSESNTDLIFDKKKKGQIHPSKNGRGKNRACFYGTKDKNPQNKNAGQNAMGAKEGAQDASRPVDLANSIPHNTLKIATKTPSRLYRPPDDRK